MRRTDRQCDEAGFYAEVFEKAQELFLALLDDEFPYCLPVNFAKIDNRLYIHAAKNGHKLDLLAANPHVAFSLACDIAIDREQATTYYKSICGRGIAQIVADPAEKGAALDAIGLRYGSRCRRPAPDKDINRVVIIRIDIVSLSGKRSLRQD